MEFLVEFEVEVPAGTPDAEVEQHQRAESAALDGLLAALPLADWLRVTVTPLEAHPNDPATGS
jgi:muconolactone delta-isomerase